MKRKWLKVLMMLMMASASLGAPMNPKEIEDLMHTMNETRIEFTMPDENHKGEGGKVDQNCFSFQTERTTEVWNIIQIQNRAGRRWRELE